MSFTNSHLYGQRSTASGYLSSGKAFSSVPLSRYGSPEPDFRGPPLEVQDLFPAVPKDSIENFEFICPSMSTVGEVPAPTAEFCDDPSWSPEFQCAYGALVLEESLAVADITSSDNAECVNGASPPPELAFINLSTATLTDLNAIQPLDTMAEPRHLFANSAERAARDRRALEKYLETMKDSQNDNENTSSAADEVENLKSEEELEVERVCRELRIKEYNTTVGRAQYEAARRVIRGLADLQLDQSLTGN